MADAVIVTVDDPAPVSVEGKNVTVTPEGAPLDDRVTSELNPPGAVSATLTVFELPAVTDTPEEAGVNAKSDASWSFQ